MDAQNRFNRLNQETYLPGEYFISRRKNKDGSLRFRKNFMTIIREEFMIKDTVKELTCENDRLQELLNIPISDILRYRDMADSVDPEEAIRFLADRFIENCGVSLGMRGFYDYCMSYWIEQLDLENNPHLNEKYHEAQTLGQILPYVSDKYYEGLLDKCDSCAMEARELRDILLDLLKTETDEKNKIILCAGICHSLPWTHRGLFWLDKYSQQKIEEGIINLKSRQLIRYRQSDDFQRYYRWVYRKIVKNDLTVQRQISENWPDEFSEKEVNHFIELNDRLVELQLEVMNQVKVITANLQEQIAKGIHQYDTFCIDGYIYIDAYDYDEDNADELLDTLCEFAKYSVIHSNDDTKIDCLESKIAIEENWYANWSGAFHSLEKTHNLKLCSAFRELFEEAEIFTIADIMKIKPAMFLPHVEINI